MRTFKTDNELLELLKPLWDYHKYDPTDAMDFFCGSLVNFWIFYEVPKENIYKVLVMMKEDMDKHFQEKVTEGGFSPPPPRMD